MHRSALGAALLGAALLIAACSPASSGESEPPEASSAPSEVPGESSGEGGASFVPGAGDLDAILPDEVDGIALEYRFASGATAIGGEGIPPEAQAFFDRTGASVDDISTAIGFAVDQADPGNPRVITIFAMRVAGVDEGALRDEFRATLETEGNSFTDESVGGKNVLAFRSSDAVDADSYLYAKGDVIFMVAGSPLELVTEALSALP